MNTHRTHHRALKIAQNCLQNFQLDLRNMHVCTEAATNNYAYTACMAALAGAHVYAIAQDTPYGDSTKAIEDTTEIAKSWNVDERITFVQKPCYEIFAKVDIVTNSGNVRPITREIIQYLKPTACISLMWETFEWRPEELDLQACHDHNILVMGTDEAKIDFFDFAAESVIKILYSHGHTIHHAKILCLGSGKILEYTCGVLRRLGIDVRCCTWGNSNDAINLEPHSAVLDDFLQQCDYILCDEREDRRVLIGKNGLIEATHIANLNPHVVIVNRHGVMDAISIEQANLHCIPTTQTASWHTPNFTTAILGNRPIIELMSAGLKVGEAMARARLAGNSLQEAAKYALKNAPAQDMLAPYNWLTSNAF